MPLGLIIAVIKMKIIHSINNHYIERDINDKENIGFLLTNGLGGYAAIAKTNNSRYNGWFVSFGQKIYKIIDDIKIQDEAKIVKIKNNYYEAERFFDNGLFESVFVPYRRNSLVYESNRDSAVEIVLDMRESYDGRSFGRNYEIFEEDGAVIVKYTKNKNWEEDKSEGKEYEIFLAVCADGGKIEKIGEWTAKHYEYDEKRSSHPFDRHIYRALKISAKKIVFSAAPDRESAKSEAIFVFKNAGNLKIGEEKRLNNVVGLPKIVDGEKTIISYIAAKTSLASLLVRDGKKFGVYAGLPWFFQFWTSDESICLKSIFEIDKEFAKKILLRDIGYIKDDGKSYDMQYAETLQQHSLNADAAGWLFRRAAEMLKEGDLGKEKIKIKITAVIEGLRKYHIKEGFLHAEAGETWMDTFFAGDLRDGARIEIQALMLALYEEAFRLTGDKKYKIWERELRDKVREKFWNGKMLADGLKDFTVRPNIFIAYYIYPKLLSKEEWKKCFEEALPRLWLDWGGLATIDKSSPFFCDEYTGEMPVSYHRGDSWYWINNLAALAFYRVDAGAFKYYIGKILKAGSEELLWCGMIGHISELSSAKEQRSEGAWAQGWSAATYMEVMEEIMKPYEIAEAPAKISSGDLVEKIIVSKLKKRPIVYRRFSLNEVISKLNHSNSLKLSEIAVAMAALFSLGLMLVLSLYFMIF